MAWRMRRVVAAVAAGVAASALVAGPAGGTGPTASELVGRLLLVRMHGTQPGAASLARIRRGEIGGVVLYADNFGRSGPARLIVALQAAARAGGRPPLLIAVDQEGGLVKRLPGAPALAPPQMRTAAVARAQGLATARTLRAAGVGVDLAPVLDVGRGGFVTPRTFGSTPAAVAARGAALAAGVARGGVLATAKHFPGLGYARLDTDQAVARVTASAAELRADWLPFRRAIAAGIPLVMMSTAVYPALGSKWPAALSPGEVHALRSLGFRGAIVTDALRTPAVARYLPVGAAAVRAVAAGCDLVLAAGVTGSRADTDGASQAAFHALVAAVRSGRLARSRVAAADERVAAVVARLPHG
jgi:beta-N-acetylhexosaminidase